VLGAIAAFGGAFAVFVTAAAIRGSRAQEQMWHEFEAAYGLTLTIGDGLLAYERTLGGTLLGAEICVSRVMLGVTRNKIIKFEITAGPVAAGWACTYHNKQFSLAKLGRAVKTGNRPLDRVARYLPTDAHDDTLPLPEAAEKIVLHWFRTASFQLRSTHVVKAQFQEGVVLITLGGQTPTPKYLEQIMAQSAALAMALSDKPIEGDPLRELRKHRLPVARAIQR